MFHSSLNIARAIECYDYDKTAFIVMESNDGCLTDLLNEDLTENILKYILH